MLAQTANFAFEPLGADGLGRLRYRRQADARGWFAELFNQGDATALGLPAFPQENLSVTAAAGTVRGLHFQLPPHDQARLVRVARGRIFNVAVDLRDGRRDRVRTLELSADDDGWLYLPPVFAHGIQTLVDDVELAWRVTRPQAPTAAMSLAFDDPDLAIPWPAPPRRDLLSPRDRDALPLAEAVRRYGAGVVAR